MHLRKQSRAVFGLVLALQLATSFGAIALLTRMGPAIAVVVDTACDLPEDLLEKHHIHPVPLRVHFGEEEYIDRFTLSSADFFRKIVAHPVHPTTSQPVPADFKRAYDLVLRLYEGAVSIHVPARHSGTYQAAVRASVQAAGKIAVVDGRTVSVGLGLLALEAVKAAEEGLALDDVVQRVAQARDRMRTFIALETMTYVVRGGRVSPWQGAIARLLKMKPVLTFSPEGELTVAAKVLGGQSVHRKALALVRQYAEGRNNLRFAIAHGNAPETAAWYADQIRRFCDPTLLYITEISPALGVHGGPGVAGVAVLGDR